jgi:hypothetical protein
MKNKTLKIQPQYTRHNRYSQPRKYPKIILSGRWLENAGFYPYNRVNLHVETDRIIITPIFPPQ